MKSRLLLLGAASLLLASCSDELDAPNSMAEGDSVPLTINVTASPETKTQIQGTLLPKDAEIGVFVTKPDGSDYLAENSYNNIKYIGTGVNNSTSWKVDPLTPVYLNTQTATAYAYYPHQASDVSLTSIPITNDGTDWMYSDPVENLDYQNATASFSLQHAMSIIRIRIVRAHETDYGDITKVSIDGNCWATGGTLNLQNGTVTDFVGEGSQLVKTDVGTLGSTALTYDHWVVATGGTSDITFKVTLNGKIFKTTVTNVTLSSGKIFNYQLSLSNTFLAVNKVTTTEWERLSTSYLKPEYTSWELVDGVYEIYDADGLRWLATTVNEGTDFSGQTVKLANDIDLDNQEWTPIGNMSHQFKGIFDGDNYTISNLKISGYNNDVGLFGFTSNGEIKNFEIHNASVSGYLDVGAVAGTPYTSDYSNIKLTGLVQINGYGYVGGMVGKSAYGDLSSLSVAVSSDSYVNANSENYYTCVGGVIGFMGEGNQVVSKVTSNINVIGSTCYVGGISGNAHYNNTFEDCNCTGNVTLTSAVDEGDQLFIGGIAGVWYNDSGTVTFRNCQFSGKLTTTLNGVDCSADVAESNVITGPKRNESGTGVLVIE